jgi:hypothetical protein
MSNNGVGVLEERVNLVNNAVLRNPLHREVLYKILEYCKVRRNLHDLEDKIVEFAEFKATGQAQFTLITYLVDAGGLDVYELNKQGKPVTPEQKSGLSEDEIDDLVAGFAYQSSEAGLTVAEEFSPEVRLAELLGTTPTYLDTYVELLKYLEERRSFTQVDTLLRGRDVLMTNRDANDRPMQPSVFIDKLEKTGVIYWKDGWQTTEEGKKILASLVQNTEAHL